MPEPQGTGAFGFGQVSQPDKAIKEPGDYLTFMPNPIHMIYLTYRFIQKGIKENGKPSLILDVFRSIMNMLARFDAPKSQS